MHAIVRIAGVQARIAPGDKVFLPKLDAEVGSTITINEVLALTDGEMIALGTPLVEGARVEAEVLRHARDQKILVFKKRRRKRYQRTRGHRQAFTEVKVTTIVVPGSAPEAEAPALEEAPASEAQVPAAEA